MDNFKKDVESISSFVKTSVDTVNVNLSKNTYDVDALYRNRHRINELIACRDILKRASESIIKDIEAANSAYNEKILQIETFISKMKMNDVDADNVAITATAVTAHNAVAAASHTAHNAITANSAVTVNTADNAEQARGAKSQFAWSVVAKKKGTPNGTALTSNNANNNILFEKKDDKNHHNNQNNNVSNVNNVTALSYSNVAAINLPVVLTTSSNVNNMVNTSNVSNNISTSVNTQKFVATSKCSITENLYLNAVVVHAFEDVVQNGMLYYNDSCNHFAVRLNGILFHGNVGDIYMNEKTPKFVKSCKYVENCSKEDCEYYHDPMRNEKSKNVRNYIANSFLYNTTSVVTPQNKMNMRRFGSRVNLDADLITMDHESAELYMNQCMHDILCVMLLCKYVL